MINGGTVSLAYGGAQQNTSLDNSAVLKIANSGSLGTGGLTIAASNARLELSNNISVLGGKDISLGARNTATDAVRNVSGTNQFGATTTYGPGGANYWFQSDAGKLILSGKITSQAGGGRTTTLRGAGDGEVSGVIQNGSATMSVYKDGSGIWDLSGDQTYSGNTTINAGTLLVSGSIDSTNLLASVSYGGTLVVANIGGQLAMGDSFTLFQSPAFSGSFQDLILPALSSELGWSNRLAIDGSLQVVRASSFRLLNPSDSSEGFGFDVDGPVNDLYAIQATTDVSKQSNRMTLDWVDTDVLRFRYVENDARSYPRRFYRAALGIPIPPEPPPVDTGTNDLGAPPEPRVPLALTYTLTNPDSGTNVGVWSISAFVENPSRRSAASFTNIQEAMNQAG